MEVRQPVPEDAPALGEVHVRAWQEGYRDGLMPVDYLASLSVDERTRMWSETLAEAPRPGRARFVADDNGVVGFIVVGPSTPEEEVATVGEVYSLNVHPDHWGRGAGAVLLAHGCAFLAAEFDQAMLWTHRDSVRSRGFYEANGWSYDGGERTVQVLGAEAPEVRYRRSL